MKTINIYTDGACRGNQSSDNLGGWGAVLEYNGHEKDLFGGEPNTTNNRMEMKALIHALMALKDKNVIVNVYSDSAYLMDCFRKKWYVEWIKNGWKTAAKKPVENKDLWLQLLDLVKDIYKINFYRVKGHLDLNKSAELQKWYQKFVEWNGDYSYEDYLEIVKYNHTADMLANKGIDEL